MAKRKLNPRKLLVASIGVATISYLGSGSVACSSDDDDERTRTKGDDKDAAGAQETGTVPTSPTVANLVVAPPPTVANLVVAPSPTATVANLVAPPRPDGGSKSR
jgi:hypothetical protein